MLTFSFLSSEQGFLRKKISLKVTARNQATNVKHQNTGLSMIVQLCRTSKHWIERDCTIMYRLSTLHEDKVNTKVK